MKDIYIILDYAAYYEAEPQVHTEHIQKEYLRYKKAPFFSTKSVKKHHVMLRPDFSGPSLEALREAGDFINESLSRSRTKSVKILIAGHGLHDDSEGIIVNGEIFPHQHIADHIRGITNSVTGDVSWEFKMLVCYGGLPDRVPETRETAENLLRHSLAYKLSQSIQARFDNPFKLTAYFTEVMTIKGHARALKTGLSQCEIPVAIDVLLFVLQNPKTVDFWTSEERHSRHFDSLHRAIDHDIDNELGRIRRIHLPVLGEHVITRANEILDRLIDPRNFKLTCARHRGVAMLYRNGYSIDSIKAIYKYRILYKIAPPSFSLKLPEKSNKVVYTSNGMEMVARVHHRERQHPFSLEPRAATDDEVMALIRGRGRRENHLSAHS
jgi:hypothetical protein